MGEFTFCVGAGALGALELTAHLQLEPTRVFGVDHVIEIDVNNSHTTTSVTATSWTRHSRTELMMMVMR